MFGGIDVGSLTAQAVLLEDGKLLAFHNIRVRPNPVDSARAVWSTLLEQRGVAEGTVKRCVATGYGRDQIQAAGLAQDNMSEISCHGMGAWSVMPSLRTLIDIGGQDAKAIRVGPAGEMINFAMNDKCASGTGRFLEVMARSLQVELGELGPLAMKAREPVALSSRCSIFCETEVLHFRQRGVVPADIAAGVTRAMAERVAALARRGGLEPEVSMSGGVAKNLAVRTELERLLGVRMLTCPVDPQVIGALGAAIFASKGQGAS
ncbi:MAG: 2-hydroxyglutaryl-CoA dehydratase [Deltaproteobacteria bacterium]|nr:2-hydroxyglutaryl-CoA dehydratase [Deltaproteobacteria bacterium]